MSQPGAQQNTQKQAVLPILSAKLPVFVLQKRQTLVGAEGLEPPTSRM
jgi:hypothetical protein